MATRLPVSAARRVGTFSSIPLDARFPDLPFLLLGDFNDDLDPTECAAGGPNNYANIVASSMVAPAYKVITLPISLAGAYSTDGYGSLIDHIIASNEMGAQYVPISAALLRIASWAVIANFPGVLSDYYPVRAACKLLPAPLAVLPFKTALADLKIHPVPAGKVLFIEGGRNLESYPILDIWGRNNTAGGEVLQCCRLKQADCRQLYSGTSVRRRQVAKILATAIAFQMTG